MKVVSKGFDPELGQKFAQEQTGSVIAHAKPSPQASVRPKREMPAGLDAQQQHEWENGWLDEDPQGPETEAEAQRLGSLRVARWRHQNEQMLKKRR